MVRITCEAALDNIRKKVGKEAQRKSLNYVSQLFGVSRGFTRYWKRKYIDRSYHPKPNGGPKTFKFDFYTRNLIEELIWILVCEDPTNVLNYYVVKARKILNVDINNQYVSRIFKRWGWSWKIIDIRKIEKYTPKNIFKYYIHALCMSSLPLSKLKFLDESGFQLKDIRRKYGIGPIGQRVYRRMPSKLNDRYNLILLSSLTNEVPYYIEITTEKVDQFFIYKFIFNSIQEGYLNPGDFLILDNASFHGATYTFKDLIDLLTLYEIYLVYLPTYSPELNPVELIFGWIKNFCKRHSLSYNIKQEILIALSFLELETICGFYYKCIYELNL